MYTWLNKQVSSHMPQMDFISINDCAGDKLFSASPACTKILQFEVYPVRSSHQKQLISKLIDTHIHADMHAGRHLCIA